MQQEMSSRSRPERTAHKPQRPAHAEAEEGEDGKAPNTSSESKTSTFFQPSARSTSSSSIEQQRSSTSKSIVVQPSPRTSRSLITLNLDGSRLDSLPAPVAELPSLKIVHAGRNRLRRILASSLPRTLDYARTVWFGLILISVVCQSEFVKFGKNFRLCEDCVVSKSI
ncbi:unnamed protein product [Amoebophrya sp. A25]|nr:unnamed protein product [Amoebophrya sp. A25]|eukprot:GSA25T00019475001.1